MKYRLTIKQSQACALGLPAIIPGATSNSGMSWMLTTTQVLAPCRSAKARFQTTSSTARPMKLARLIARLDLTRGVSHSSDGSGLRFLAKGHLQPLCRVCQTLPEGATEGDFMFVEQTLAVRTGMVTRAVRRATTAGFPARSRCKAGRAPAFRG